MTRIIVFFFLISFTIPGKSQSRLSSVILKSTEGEEVRLSDYAALKKPLIISFWATYCGPCLEEFEAVTDLYEEWKKEVDFEFIAVSIDDARSAAKVKSMASGKKWPFIILIDENQDVKRAMNVTDIPFCFIFDKYGKYVYRHAGYLPGDEFIMLKELKKIPDE